MSDFSKEKIRTGVIIAIIAILLAYIVLSERLFFEAKVYGAFFALTILGLFGFNYFYKKSSKKESIDKAYFGISDHWIKGIFAGAIFSAIFLIITQIKFLSTTAQLLVPQIGLAVGLSITGSFAVLVLIAPQSEESFFKTILSYLNLTRLPFFVIAILTGLLFSSAHFYSYIISANTTLQYALGAFVGAFVFGTGTCYMAKYFGLESSITAHLIFNFVAFNSATHLLAIAP